MTHSELYYHSQKLHVPVSRRLYFTETHGGWEKVLPVWPQSTAEWLLHRSCVLLSCSCGSCLSQASKSGISGWFGKQ